MKYIDLVDKMPESLVIPHHELISHGCKNCVWKLHNQCPYGLVGSEFYVPSVHGLRVSSGASSVSVSDGVSVNPTHQPLRECDDFAEGTASISQESSNLLSRNSDTASGLGIFPDSAVHSGAPSSSLTILKYPLMEGICPEFTEFLYGFADGPHPTLSSLFEKYNLYVIRLQSLEDYSLFIKKGKEIERLISEHQSNPDEISDLKAELMGYKLWWSRLNELVLKSLSRVVDRESKQQNHQVKKISLQQFNLIINENQAKLLEHESSNAPSPISSVNSPSHL